MHTSPCMRVSYLEPFSDLNCFNSSVSDHVCLFFIICRLNVETDGGNWPRRNSSSDWTYSYRLGMYGSTFYTRYLQIWSMSACKKTNWHCVFSAAWSERLQRLLQQPACSQSSAGPEKAGQAGPGLPAALPGVALQQEAGPLELPRHSTFTPGEIPAATARDPQAHSSWQPRHSQSGESCMSSILYTPYTQCCCSYLAVESDR